MAKRSKKAPESPATTALALAEPDPVEAMAAKFRADADASVDALRSLAVTNAEEEALAIKLAADVKDRVVEVHALRRHFLEPHEEGVKRTNGFWMPIEKTLEAGFEMLKEKVAALRSRNALEGDRLVREAGAAGAAGDAAKAAELLEQRAALEPQKIEGVSSSTTWTGAVDKPELIPREYLIPDVATLLARTKAMKGDPQIPGWRAFPSTSVSITASKVQR